MNFHSPLYIPLDDSGDFTFEGVSFHWLHKERWDESRLSFRYGAAQVAMTRTFDMGLLGTHDKISVWVDGLAFEPFADSAKIADARLRAAVELGLRAWLAQSQINQAASKEAQAAALKRL
jgi:hypothetical protein